MLKGLQYIAVSAIVVFLFWTTQHQLTAIRGLTTDATYYTTQLAELTRLEKEMLQFRADVAGYHHNNATSKRESMMLAFDILWSRVNTEYNRKLDPPIATLTKHNSTLGELAQDLRSIEQTVHNLKDGDEAGWREIDAVMARTAAKVSNITTDAYAELYRHATASTTVQREAISGFRKSLQIFLGIILAGLMLLLWQLRKVERLNSALNEKEVEITKLAIRDPLTEIFNRRHFDAKLNAIDVGPHLDDLHIAIIDLDGFKQVNDTRGHACGDAVLRSVAQRLATRLPSKAILARLGGDEFAILLTAQYAEMIALSKDIITDISKPILHDGELLAVGASIGISSQVATRHTTSQMMKNADVALYSAKANGRGKAVHFNDIQ